MADWDDDLFNELEQKKAETIAAEEDRQRIESTARGYAQSYFDELLNVAQREIYRLDSKRFGNRRELNLGYTDNTITGDHFLIHLANLTMTVEFDRSEMEIAYQLKAFVGDLNRFIYEDIPEHSGTFKIRLVGNKLEIFHNNESVTIERMAQILLTESISALEERRMRRGHKR
jgi:hypothetical protein